MSRKRASERLPPVWACNKFTTGNIGSRESGGRYSTTKVAPQAALLEQARCAWAHS